ncbi:helicase-like transcription factor isoform X1 [Pygocentrus nattereri]|uniref:Helicase-like transcription factor n=1 Tax=Pygocentrus nattereri TaxID=42514 RepID=A0A3B4D5T7_PYGNA|nr:helicase-like transcription factor isoform X1 [Pygocentrus nattereri]XP_037402326.1 helicase-like transcription factor isoform X1 [Pygocentrus nattereri]
MQSPAVRRRFGGVSLFDFLDVDQSESLSQSSSSAGGGSDQDQDQEENLLIGSIQGTIVGLRYYTGVVNRGEMVSLVREPQNPYDRNAVKVTNVYGVQVGHIKKELAAAMAHIMDRKLAKVEGVVPFGQNYKFSMPVELTFWGKEENREAVHSQMKRHGYKLGSSAKGSSSVASWERRGFAGSSSEIPPIALTEKQLKNAFDKLFEDMLVDRTQEMEAAEAVRTPLLRHQKQALCWMTSRENNTALPPFWEQKSGLYFNVLTNFAVKERPSSVLGGILADDMGLGKTLTTIALILSNFHDGKPLRLQNWGGERSDAGPSTSKAIPKGSPKVRSGHNTDPERRTQTSSLKRPHAKSSCADDDDDDVVFVSQSAPRSKKEGGAMQTQRTSDSKHKRSAVVLYDVGFGSALESGCSSSSKSSRKKISAKSSGADNHLVRPTLIVCPLSVLSNWMDQFELHVREDVKLNVYLYYGPDRRREVSFLSKQDVVLTTYSVLSSDYANTERSALHRMRWLRVVLDEGHVIRNPNAQQSKAVLELNAERRWILSGTPIQNSLKDLWMLICFLKLKPFDVREWWTRVIQRPVMMGDRDGLKNLQGLVKTITLRRTKTSRVDGRALLELPEKKVYVQQVVLSLEEREEYEREKAEGRSIISRYVREDSVMRNYADVLAILVRLRLSCCHCDLVGKQAPAGTETVSPDELRERLLSKVRLVLSSGSDEECSVCLDSLRQPVITHCAHVFCKPCICEVIQSQTGGARCPLCRADIKSTELVEFPGEEDDSGIAEGKETWRSGSKVDALMKNLLKLRSEDPTIKSLVVSQFTKFLNLLEVPLRDCGFSFTRLDGSMCQKARVKAVSELQDTSPGSPTVMLLSLKAGGVGLNLAAASRVFLMEPAWNPAAEDQCVDRCHRLGQSRDVVITKFVVKDSVEENIVKIQKKKQELVEKVLGARSAEERKRARIEEIRSLMEI